MRYVTLHLRARRVPAATVATLVISMGAWLVWFFASDERQAGPPLAAVTVMLACVAASVTFGSDDEDLDRTAALSWPRLRAIHLLVTVSLLIGLFTTTLATAVQFGSFTFVVRDVVGLLGLTTLCAVALGAQRAWFAPVCWSVITLFWGGPTTNHGMQVLTWMTQPVEATASMATALALAVIGTGVYIRGRASLPRPESL
jgi:hypothetical protein